MAQPITPWTEASSPNAQRADERAATALEVYDSFNEGASAGFLGPKLPQMVVEVLVAKHTPIPTRHATKKPMVGPDIPLASGPEARQKIEKRFNIPGPSTRMRDKSVLRAPDLALGPRNEVDRGETNHWNSKQTWDRSAGSISKAMGHLVHKMSNHLRRCHGSPAS